MRQKEHNISTAASSHAMPSTQRAATTTISFQDQKRSDGGGGGGWSGECLSWRVGAGIGVDVRSMGG